MQTNKPESISPSPSSVPEHPAIHHSEVINSKAKDTPGEIDSVAIDLQPHSPPATYIPQSTDAQTAFTRFNQETLDALVVIGLALVALVVRLIGLGWHPLSDAEANQAMVAWQVYRGQAPAQLLYSPLLISLNLFSFGLLGDSDLTARLGPALLACTPCHRLCSSSRAPPAATSEPRWAVWYW